MLNRVHSILPPAIINFLPNQGFFVTAAVELKPYTLICEYLGEVRTSKQTSQMNNDSVMQLLAVNEKVSKDMTKNNQKNLVVEQEDSLRSLDIAPLRYANIGRFFNGINNAELGSKTLKQNLCTMRVQVPSKRLPGKNECRVLIFTSRRVRAGEQMLFDYNEGVLSNGKDLLYDTTGFV